MPSTVGLSQHRRQEAVSHGSAGLLRHAKLPRISGIGTALSGDCRNWCVGRTLHTTGHHCLYPSRPEPYQLQVLLLMLGALESTTYRQLTAK